MTPLSSTSHTFTISSMRTARLIIHSQCRGGDYLLLQSKSNRQMREYYNKLPRKDQESFDQDEISLRALLGLDPDRVYTIEDLNDEEVHDRALRLLYRARFGQVNEYARISPHINYDQLDRTVSDHIESKLSVAAGTSYVYHTYRHLRTARKYQNLTQASTFPLAKR